MPGTLSAFTRHRAGFAESAPERAPSPTGLTVRHDGLTVDELQWTLLQDETTFGRDALALGGLVAPPAEHKTRIGRISCVIDPDHNVLALFTPQARGLAPVAGWKQFLPATGSLLRPARPGRRRRAGSPGDR